MRSDNYFVQVPDWITNSGISDGAYRLYAVLGTYASRDRRTCYPARSTLAERTGKNVRSVTRYLQELEDLGAIRVTHRKSEESPKEWTSNEYMLITTPPASVSPPGDTHVTTPGDTSVQGVVTQMSHKQEPLNQNHKNAPADADAAFEAFWDSYPAERKGGKRGEKGAFSRYKALAAKYGTDGLMDRLQHYKRTRARLERAGEFVSAVPHVTTWLNQQRWDDFGEYKPGPVELTADEVNQILGPDHWAPESPDGGFQTVEEELQWRQAAYAARLEERKQRAKEVMTGGTVGQDS